MRAANTSIEQLIVSTLNAKGYARSAPYDSAAWRAKPIFLQSFEVNSLRRFADLTPTPLVYLLDKAPDPETRQELVDIVSDGNLADLAKFVTVISPWKDLLYNVVYTVEGAQIQKLQSSGLTERLKQRGFKVHAYTLRDEPRYVLPTCGGDIACEFRFLFDTEGLDGASADWPGTLVKWVRDTRGPV
jgi:glycerophosphoryl diester phosphodiesterase